MSRSSVVQSWVTTVTYCYLHSAPPVSSPLLPSFPPFFLSSLLPLFLPISFPPSFPLFPPSSHILCARQYGECLGRQTLQAAWGSKKDRANKGNGEAFWVSGAVRCAHASQGSFGPHGPARGGAVMIPTVQVGTRRWRDEGHMPSEGRSTEMNGRLTSEPVHPQATAMTSVTSTSKGEGIAQGCIVGPESKAGDRGSGPFGLRDVGRKGTRALLLRGGGPAEAGAQGAV